MQNNNPTAIGKMQGSIHRQNVSNPKRNALSIDIYKEEVILKKLNYTHLNPVNACLVTLPEQYPYSSASLYFFQEDKFWFLSHCSG
jgi:hypothetical protein